MPAAIFITVHPDAVSAAALQGVEYVIALGHDAPRVIAIFCTQIGVAPPATVSPPGRDEVLFWARRSGVSPVPVRAVRPKQARRRHTRKYAEGNVGEDLSFYFRGPEGKLHLRAQNLMCSRKWPKAWTNAQGSITDLRATTRHGLAT